MIDHLSKWIDSPQNQKHIDTITHYCRAERNRGKARFVIYVNNKDISKSVEENEEEKPRIMRKEEPKVSIGIMKDMNIRYRAE